MESKTYVYLNGKVIGHIDNPQKFVAEVRAARRKGQISGEINIAHIEKLNSVNINTDRGRLRKPYIIVEGGKSKFTPELAERIKKKEINFSYLVRSGIIEYLDAEEEENALVAIDEASVTEKSTHLDFDLTSILGLSANLAPYAEHNAISRQAMSVNYMKQSEGLYATNFNQRFDSRTYVLFYPQAPLITTAPYEALDVKRHASGQNLVVALSTYYGYNMSDALVINKAAVDRGVGRSMFYKSYTDEERRYPGGQRDRFRMPPPTSEGYMGEHAYSKLSEDGIIEPEMAVDEGDVLIGKVAPPRFLEENIGASGLEERTRDDSVVLKPGENGVVDSILFTETPGATRTVKVRIRSIRIPEKGDKFASRHGQKGVVALIANPEDMPFTASGIVPDILLNPLSIPSRLTFGHLLEEIAGKASAVSGNKFDGTAFTESGRDRLSQYGEVLKSHGFDDNGNEVLYDGITGRPFKASIFTGITYYYRLYHMVSNKMQVRSRGKVQILTHQPTEGKARQGALRFGEMERDALIGYGASLLLKERMLDQSDKTTVLICRQCGGMGYYDHIKRTQICPLCGNSSLAEVEISYAFKVLLDEIRSMHIMPRVKLKE
ncbi:MAG: DNA-directed RNA polymerase subunit B [Candidatus Marsarchaeota archaeon]|nr:DNA-directed RNA polymerase subunit B [Candidatus Marsarchaeota archaeon]